MSDGLLGHIDSHPTAMVRSPATMSLLYHGRLLFFDLLFIGLGLTGCQKESESVVSIALHPTNANILYVATNDAVYKSRDGGGTWERFPSFSARRVTTLAIDPFLSATIYADCGETWCKDRLIPIWDRAYSGSCASLPSGRYGTSGSDTQSPRVLWKPGIRRSLTAIGHLHGLSKRTFVRPASCRAIGSSSMGWGISTGLS